MKLHHAVCFAFLLGSAAVGRPAQGGFDPMGLTRSTMVSPGFLLNMKEFRNEIKLTSPQAKKIDPILKQYQKELNTIQKETSGSGGANFGGLMKRMADNETTTAAAIKAELLPEQWVRFRQIQLQILSYRAFYEADVMAALELTPDQVSQIETHKRGEMQRLQQTLMKNQGSGVTKAMKKLREDSSAELLAILTEAQKAKFKELIGPESKAATKRAESVF